MNVFRDKYKVDLSKNQDDTVEYTGLKFNPNITAKEISKEQLVEFANLVKGTPHENLIAFKNPKVQELVDYIMATIIFENERLNSPNYFPIQIYRRYKSDNSLKNKILNWENREDKQGSSITDYLGFKIIPEAEHSIFTADGDPILKEMIDKREETRKFIADMYKELSDSPTLTFEEYCIKCSQVLHKLIDIFPIEAVARKEYYNSLIEKIASHLESYTSMFEDSDIPMHLNEILQMTNVNIKSLLSELTLNYPNEVVLYKLKNDLMHTFENSDLLKELRNFSFTRFRKN